MALPGQQSWAEPAPRALRQGGSGKNLIVLMATANAGNPDLFSMTCSVGNTPELNPNIHDLVSNVIVFEWNFPPADRVETA